MTTDNTLEQLAVYVSAIEKSLAKNPDVLMAPITALLLEITKLVHVELATQRKQIEEIKAWKDNMQAGAKRALKSLEQSRDGHDQ